jgi:hypothetical protein
VDLSTLGITLEELCQDNDNDYMEFEYEKSLVPKQIHVKLLWPMKKLHEWYYFACVYEMNFVEAHFHGDIFMTLDFDLHVKLYELHAIYRTCLTSIWYNSIHHFMWRTRSENIRLLKI